jgi:hypothetical protein
MLKKAPREGLVTLRNMAKTCYNTPDCALLSSRNLQLDGENRQNKVVAKFVSTGVSLPVSTLESITMSAEDFYGKTVVIQNSRKWVKLPIMERSLDCAVKRDAFSHEIKKGAEAPFISLTIPSNNDIDLPVSTMQSRFWRTLKGWCCYSVG